MLLVAPGLFVGVACEQAAPSSEIKYRTVSSELQCPDCKVSLRHVTTLTPQDSGSSPRPDAIGRECTVARSRNGEFLVSGLVGGGRIEVFDSKGNFVRSIGNAGSGPGEFGSIVRILVGPGDSLTVMDDSNLRVQVILPNGQYVRSFPLPARNRNFTMLSSGQLVFFRPPTRPEDAVFSVHSREGEETGRFGTTTGVPLDLETGIVVPDRARGMWTASYWKYELSHWTVLDSTDRVITRDVSWFPPNGPYPADVFKTALPPPALVHAWEDENDRLWTYVVLPDPKWKPGGPTRQSPDWYPYTFDSAIEVIDLVKSQLVSSTRFDARFGFVCNSGLMYTIVETSDGDTRIQILEPTLESQ